MMAVIYSVQKDKDVVLAENREVQFFFGITSMGLFIAFLAVVLYWAEMSRSVVQDTGIFLTVRAWKIFRWTVVLGVIVLTMVYFGLMSCAFLGLSVWQSATFDGY